MAIAERGYTHWKGELRSRGLRWFTIARWGVKQSGQSKWLKRLVLMAWLPLLYWVLAFFVVGQVTEASTIDQAKDMWQFQLMRVQFGSKLAEEFIKDPAAFRPMVWSTLVYFFLRYTQLFWVMIVVAIVGPKLVSQDLQSRSLALYFSKPLTRFDYVTGKLAVVGFWVAMVTLIPTLVLYGLSILFSPSGETLAQTFTVVPRVIAYSLLLVFGTGAPMLALSSLTSNARFLGFLWAGGWVMTHVASFVLSVALFLGDGGKAVKGNDWTGVVSYFKNLDSVAYRLLDLDALLTPAAALSPKAAKWLDRLSYDHDWRISLALILTVSVASLVVVTLRIGKPGEAGSK